MERELEPRGSVTSLPHCEIHVNGASDCLIEDGVDPNPRISALASHGHAPQLAHENEDAGKWRTVVLAYKTLGVVFGGLVTSPLYVYPSMRLTSPSKADYLGIYCIIFWTLTLIGVVKYALIALKANDHGEGTFALYSLLCRHADVGSISSRKSNSSMRLSHCGIYATPDKSYLVKFIEQSVIARRLLLFVAMLGVCMLIGDGILTPAISVLSAMDGLKGPFHSISQSAIEALSAGVLIILFLVQKFGTSRVSFLFSPIMAAWTFSTPIIGVYSILKYYPSIFKALSPHYAVLFFLRNGKKAWLLLSGIVLCITGSEAMFADLGHFSQRSIQIAFLFTIYPSLVLTYAGQTAYLIINPNDHSDGFYKFVPKPIYWPMFVVSTLAATVASQSLISATFSVIKQAVVLDYFPRLTVKHTSRSKEGEVYSPEVNYILMVLCIAVVLGFRDGQDLGNAFGVVVILVMLITTILLTLVMIIIWKTPLPLVALYFIPFFILEGVYVSSVFTKIPEGGWLPFAISIFLVLIMFTWYYGRQKKTEYEMTNKTTLDGLSKLLSHPGVNRVPGLCFFYSNIPTGLPQTLEHYVKNMRSLHRVIIITTFKYLMVAKVAGGERIIIKRLGLKGVYRCIVQYGYADCLNPEGDDINNRVINCLRTYLEKSSAESPELLQEEISELDHARKLEVVHVLGKTRFQISKRTRWFDKVFIGFYKVLHENCRSALPSLGIPLNQRVEVGMLCEA
ncbi:hypothetical protein AMTRI_Chr04g181230 [Amborella trichopoda]